MHLSRNEHGVAEGGRVYLSGACCLVGKTPEQFDYNEGWIY